MGGQLQLQGNLTSGPLQGSQFNAGRLSINVALALKGGAGAKAFGASTGIQAQSLAAADYEELALGGVTKGDTLYFFAYSPILVRLKTFLEPDPLLSEIPVDGLVVLEFNAARYLTLLEAKGNANIEYLVTGQ